MLLPEEVEKMISKIIPCEYVKVEGDGHHFFATIVSESFNNVNRLGRHRLIKDGLKERLASNELHALSITTAATPDEWKFKQA